MIGWERERLENEGHSLGGCQNRRGERCCSLSPGGSCTGGEKGQMLDSKRRWASEGWVTDQLAKGFKKQSQDDTAKFTWADGCEPIVVLNQATLGVS